MYQFIMTDGIVHQVSIQSFSSLQCSGKFPSMSSLRHLWQNRTAGLKYFFTFLKV